MMKKAILCALLLAPMLAFGQTGATTANGYLPRSLYDPGVAMEARASRQSGVAAALEKINPQNENYGQLIDQGKLAAIEETIDNFYWRSSMVLTVLLMLAIMYIMWLWRERDLRLSISGDILAQLYNSHVTSRAKALETIEMHNKLARRYNAQTVELAKLREASIQKAPPAESKAGLETAELLHAQRTKSTANVHKEETPSAIADPNSASDVVEEDECEAATTGNAEQLREQLRQSTAQIKAGEQKISNLRTQLARAHHSLEEARGKTPSRRQA